MESIIQEIANVGFTLLVFVIGLVIVNKFKGDKQMIELTCKKCDDVTITCDEGVTAVTCSMCSMIDVEVCDD